MGSKLKKWRTGGYLPQPPTSRVAELNFGFCRVCGGVGCGCVEEFLPNKSTLEVLRLNRLGNSCQSRLVWQGVGVLRNSCQSQLVWRYCDSIDSENYRVSGDLELCNTLQHTATHCNTLQHTATIKTLQLLTWSFATHCNTLQHTATHCNTLQHTAVTKSTPSRCGHGSVLQWVQVYCSVWQWVAEP